MPEPPLDPESATPEGLKEEASAKSEAPIPVPDGEAPSLEDDGMIRRETFPPVRFPKLELPLPGAEPRGLDGDRQTPPGGALPPEPKVSVVLYNHDDADRLWNFMFALKAQTRPPDEVLLVDNGSTDESVEFVRVNHPEVRVMELEEVFPKDQAWNLGFLAAGGDLVALVDASLALPPEWLRRAVDTFKTRASNAGVVVCPVVGPSGTEAAPVYNVLGHGVATEAPFPGGEPFGLPIGAWIARRRLFPEGPFEEDLPQGPDPFALGWKLRAFGSRAVWAFDARVLRPTEAVPESLLPWRSDYLGERRRAATFYVSAETGTFVKLLPLWCADAFVRPLGRLFHPGGSFWGTLIGLATVPFLWARLGKARERMRRSRSAPDTEVTSRLSGRISSGRGVLSGLWNAFCGAYLAAVGVPTRESLKDRMAPVPTPAPEA